MCFVYAFMIGIVLTNKQEISPFLWVLAIIMMVVLPLSLLLYSFFYCYNDVILDENGIYRVWCGKVVKQFRWDEIKLIGCTSEDTFSGWVYFSTKTVKYTYLSVDMMRMSPNVICFHLTSKNIVELKKCIEEYNLKEKCFDIHL